MTAQACTLPGVAASVGDARDFTRRVLAAAGVPACPEAEACVSELAGNAVSHTLSGRPGGTFTVQVAVGGSVQIEVRDQGTADSAVPAIPAQRPPLDAEHGRGLWLVAELADRCELTPGLAWFEIALESIVPAASGRAAA